MASPNKQAYNGQKKKMEKTGMTTAVSNCGTTSVVNNTINVMVKTIMGILLSGNDGSLPEITCDAKECFGYHNKYVWGTNPFGGDSQIVGTIASCGDPTFIGMKFHHIKKWSYNGVFSQTRLITDDEYDAIKADLACRPENKDPKYVYTIYNRSEIRDLSVEITDEKLIPAMESKIRRMAQRLFLTRPEYFIHVTPKPMGLEAGHHPRWYRAAFMDIFSNSENEKNIHVCHMEIEPDGGIKVSDWEKC